MAMRSFMSGLVEAHQLTPGTLQIVEDNARVSSCRSDQDGRCAPSVDSSRQEHQRSRWALDECSSKGKSSLRRSASSNSTNSAVAWQPTNWRASASDPTLTGKERAPVFQGSFPHNDSVLCMPKRSASPTARARKTATTPGNHQNASWGQAPASRVLSSKLADSMLNTLQAPKKSHASSSTPPRASSSPKLGALLETEPLVMKPLAVTARYGRGGKSRDGRRSRPSMMVSSPPRSSLPASEQKAATLQRTQRSEQVRAALDAMAPIAPASSDRHQRAEVERSIVREANARAAALASSKMTDKYQISLTDDQDTTRPLRRILDGESFQSTFANEPKVCQEGLDAQSGITRDMLASLRMIPADAQQAGVELRLKYVAMAG